MFKKKHLETWLTAYLKLDQVLIPGSKQHMWEEARIWLVKSEWLIWNSGIQSQKPHKNVKGSQHLYENQLGSGY